MANKQTKGPNDGWAKWQLDEVNRTAAYAASQNAKAKKAAEEEAHRSWLKQRAAEMKSPKYRQDKWFSGVKSKIRKSNSR